MVKIIVKITIGTGTLKIGVLMNLLKIEGGCTKVPIWHQGSNFSLGNAHLNKYIVVDHLKLKLFKIY